MFSTRNGFKSTRATYQINEMDEALSIKIWNALQLYYFSYVNIFIESHVDELQSIWSDWKGSLIDTIPMVNYTGREVIVIDEYKRRLKDHFFQTPWFERYDLVEYILMCRAGLNDILIQKLNYVLQIEMAGYRIVNNNIIPIVSDDELNEIDSIFNSSPWTSVQIHIKTAVQLFGDRKSPDYRNSIKESISAVESAIHIITEGRHKQFANALKEIEVRFDLHGAFKNAFNSLYGYTSDSGGIRHALLEDNKPVTFEDAKFMLISCSAFINYLKFKTQ